MAAGVRYSSFLILAIVLPAFPQAETPAGLVKRAEQALAQPSPEATLAAEKYLQEAVRLWATTPQTGSPEYADAATLLSVIMLGRQRPLADIRSLADQAIPVFEAPSADPLKLALALEVKARTYGDAGDPTTAKPLIDRATALRIQSIGRLGGSINVADTEAATRIGDGVSRPVLISKQEPEYSNLARLSKHQGTAVFSVIIEPDGRTSTHRLVRSLGFGLDEQAYQALQQWRFKPSEKDGQPVRVQANVEINFRLL